MMGYAFLSFHKYKSSQTIAASNKHDERLGKKYSNPNIDPERVQLNYHLIEPKGQYKDVCRDMIEDAGCRKRSTSILMVEAMISPTPEFINAMPLEEQRKFFERSLDALYERVEKDRFISSVVHMDETNPHMHVCFCPITRDGRLSWSSICGRGRNALSIWQDEFYEHMHAFYPDLERGLSTEITHREHIPARIYRLVDDIQPLIDEVYEELGKVTMTNVFNVGKIRKKVRGLHGDIRKMYYNLAMNAKDAADKNVRLEKVSEEKDREILLLNEEMDEVKSELGKAESEIRQLKTDNMQMQELIWRIPPDLRKKITEEMEEEQQRAAERRRASRAMAR